MFRFFRKFEANHKIKVRLLKLAKEGDYGICPPPMEASTAVYELRDFFLGKDWRATVPDSEQAFSEIVYQIECRNKPILHVCNKLKPLQPMNAYQAILKLCDFLLGEDWCITISVSPEQAITEIVYEIETKYKIFRKIS